MAWIESHQSIGNHPKLMKLSRAMGWTRADAVGRLHLFWHWCLDYAPDGQLDKHGREVVADVFGVDASDSDKVIQALHDADFLDFEPQFRVHDWWDYAGRYLQVRYKNKAKTWKDIKRLYGHSVQRTKQPTKNRPTTDNATINQPTNLNQPTLTNQPPPTTSRARPISAKVGLEDFTVTPELSEWAQSQGIPNPEVYVEEFKDYWRGEGKRKSDWSATFKNRLRYLRDHGKLKRPSVWETFADDQTGIHADVPKAVSGATV